MALEASKISELTEAQRLASKVAFLGYRELVFNAVINIDTEELVSLTIISDDETGITPEYIDGSSVLLSGMTDDMFERSVLYGAGGNGTGTALTFTVNTDEYHVALIGNGSTATTMTIVIRIYNS